MPNTVYGPYTPTSWVNGVSAANATTMNNLEKQASGALHSFNPDMIGAGFVYSGVTTAKDGTLANQLDIASGVAYVVFSDGTVGRITVVTDNTHTTATPSTTYHLYLQPDGTWYWNTANTPAANSLHICDVTTDGSGNIATVTDLRPLYTTMFSGMAGNPGVPLIVAQALDVHVTATTDQTILSFTPAVKGLYRVSVHISMGNTSAETIAATVHYTDPHLGTPIAVFCETTTGSPVGITPLNGANSVGPSQSLPCAPIVMWAGTGGAITVHYGGTAGTPNDYISAVIERLA